MKTLNKVSLIGHLGAEPQIRELENSNSVARCSIATTETWKDKDGKSQSSTDWHNLVLWGKLAELARQHFKKGMRLYVEGKLKNRKFTTKSGELKLVNEIIVESLLML